MILRYLSMSRHLIFFLLLIALAAAACGGTRIHSQLAAGRAMTEPNPNIPLVGPEHGAEEHGPFDADRMSLAAYRAWRWAKKPTTHQNQPVIMSYWQFRPFSFYCNFIVKKRPPTSSASPVYISQIQQQESYLVNYPPGKLMHLPACSVMVTVSSRQSEPTSKAASDAVALGEAETTVKTPSNSNMATKGSLLKEEDIEDISEAFDPFLNSADSSAPWRGSQIVFRNSFSINSLDRSAELTYNPYYAISWSFKPRWWFGDHVFVRAGIDLTRELTEADEETYSGETVVGDLVLVGGISKFYTIPWVGVDMSADLVLTTPTSKVSQARTLNLGIGPGLRLSKTFKLLKALIVGYNLRVTPYSHRKTTSERETPLISGCIASEGGCDAFLNTGVRNPALRLVQVGDVTLVILDWLGVSISFGHVIDWLYSIDNDDPRVSYQPQEPADQRFLSIFEVEAFINPMDSLEIGLGYSTVNPQLAPDSTYYNPFYNRYTRIYLDLRLRVDGLISQIKGE